MQIISGKLHSPKVHFEAPPSKIIKKEMTQFIKWFNKMEPHSNKKKLAVLIRSGIAHLYFVSLHPFEDGNGRIGRAISEKVLAQELNKPTLIALSCRIEKYKKDYYAALEQADVWNN